jgi:hypothetical protein
MLPGFQIDPIGILYVQLGKVLVAVLALRAAANFTFPGPKQISCHLSGPLPVRSS